MKAPIAGLVALMVFASSGAQAHGANESKPHAPAAQIHEMSTPFGRPGNPATADRTVTIRMADTMRFSPDLLDVKQGERVRFVIHNDGQLLHEMVLGSDEHLQKHAALMRKFPEMEHDEPNMVHVNAGKVGELVWTFDKPGEVGFACLIPGHFEAGMTGKVIVK